MGSADTFELKNLRGAAQLLGDSVSRLSTRASFAHIPQGLRATTPRCQAKVDEQNDGAADRRSIGVVMGSVVHRREASRKFTDTEICTAEWLSSLGTC